MARPAEYALAHLPQYHALEFGRSGYFLLREPALGLCSLTYFVNEASEHWSPRAATDQPLPPNVAYKVVRPREGGVALGLLCLEVRLPLPCYALPHYAAALTVVHRLSHIPLATSPLALPRGAPRPLPPQATKANPDPSH